MEILKWAFYLFAGLLGFAIALYVFFSPLMLIVGLFKPSAVLSDEKPQTRPRVLKNYGITAAIMAALIYSGAFSSVTAQTSSYAISSPPAVSEVAYSEPTEVSEPISQQKPVESWISVRSDRAIKITDVETVSQIDSDNQFIDPIESNGGQLVVVYMTLKNTGEESGNTMFTKFQLVDAEGRKYDTVDDFLSVNAWLDEKGLDKNSTQIFPGGTIETAQVFRVAPDAADLKMAVNGRVFSVS